MNCNVGPQFIKPASGLANGDLRVLPSGIPILRLYPSVSLLGPSRIQRSAKKLDRVWPVKSVYDCPSFHAGRDGWVRRGNLFRGMASGVHMLEPARFPDGLFRI
jgi:hypothetical protein